jgi:4-amino-4-deoxy-L-arabinose transferase-like glycosyltransferase
LPIPPRRRAAIAAAAFAALCVVYLYGLARTGLIGPDEPRYAAIGRHMAASGDWLMPVLWGKPWFEKPPLLYWMTAVGFRCGLGPDLAPRVPVALISLGFVWFFWTRLRRPFGEQAAAIAALMLAASGGWLAFSRVAVPDLPLAAIFSAAMLLLMTAEGCLAFAVAGALLGLAVLAKALVPLVLVLPALWFRRRQWPRLALALSVAFAVAIPWYAAMYARAGRAFLDELFLRQQFARFFTPERQHVQPFWFYVPVLLLAMLPWTPALALLNRRILGERYVPFLAAWAIWGLVFFSAATNKLPGYVLPLLPPLCVLAGVALDRAPRSIWVIPTCGFLLALFGAAEAMLPAALSSGIRHAGFVLPFAGFVPAAAAMMGGAFLDRAGRRRAAVAAIAAVVLGMAVVAIDRTLPMVDTSASARPSWNFLHPKCIPTGVDRAMEYGLNYYADSELPACPAGR